MSVNSQFGGSVVEMMRVRVELPRGVDRLDSTADNVDTATAQHTLDIGHLYP